MLTTYLIPDNQSCRPHLLIEKVNTDISEILRTAPPSLVTKVTEMPALHSKHLDSLKKTFSTITMQPQENHARVHPWLYGNSTEGFLLKNLNCLKWRIKKSEKTAIVICGNTLSQIIK